MIKLIMHDKINEEPSPSDSNQKSPKSRLDQSFSLAANVINILAAIAKKPESEKSWDRAERDRKRLHDDRTYKRQGWAVGIAVVAVVFNFTALVGLGVQSWNAHNAVQVAQQTLAMNSRPSVALSNMNVIAENKSIVMTFTIENKSTGAVYIYDNPIGLSNNDKELSYKELIFSKKNSPAVAQIFPMSGDTSKRIVPLLHPLGEKEKGKKIYATFAVFVSSFGQERYIVSQCKVFTWTGESFITDNKLCANNQRYETLENYLSEKNFPI